jgi:hypothetical protein
MFLDDGFFGGVLLGLDIPLLRKMSHPNSQDQQQVPRVSRTGAISGGAGSGIASTVGQISKESWMHPAKVLLTSIVISVVIGLVIYYTTSVFLTPHVTGGSGIFEKANWLTAGGGSLFILLVALLIGLCGASIGMSWKNNGISAIWAMGTSAIVGLLYYILFASAKDGRKDQFVFWSFLSTIVAVAIPGYGWWQTRKLSNEAKTTHSPEAAQLSQRATWSMIFFGVSAVLAMIVAAGLWQIHGALASPISG